MKTNTLLKRPLALADVIDMTALNDPDRFYLATDTIDRVPKSGEKSCVLKEQRHVEINHQ